MAPQLVEDLVDRITKAKGLDKIAEPLSDAVSTVVRPGLVKDALSGTWLGHPLHPLLTDVTIGAWTSAFVLDVFGSESTEGAADTLIGVGVASAVPTVVSGYSDWSDLFGAPKRLGVVHLMSNAGAIACYGLSWLARRKGDRSRGLALSFLGATLATVGGYLGAHLSYRKGVNVDHNAWQEGPQDWVTVLDAAELGPGTRRVVRAEDIQVLLVNEGGTIHAIAEVCGHAGGPLHDGTFEGGCVTCPWHGSTFRLADGSVVHGPATGPQPAFDVRVDNGKVLVRARS
ncbi:MAG TPA: Rieske 2Fe-2S domain-containing protein [Acidimicrobiales bacterium]|nr:Rieske 2Fe-2S domain-containing protein [Acidimicrobiales bacterium]